ncbi:MAG: EAL domain-containing protein [Alkalimonas sp.]|nr:EAL domain-containing protein [Alkalimonas sp.]
MFSSLRSRLLIVITLLLSLMALATAMASLKAMKDDSQQQAHQVLSVATNVFEQLLADRSSQLSQSVQVLAADFAFRRAVATSESDTIQSVLENHGSRIEAQLVILLSTQGELLASTQPELDKSRLTTLLSGSQWQTAQSHSSIQRIAEQAYQLVLVPVRAPSVIAWVGMGFELDTELATQLKSITGLDISFTLMQQQGETADIQWLSSTLAQHSRQQVQLSAKQYTAAQTEPVSSADLSYLSMARPLDADEQLWALLHLPNSRWLQSYQNMREQLLLIFGIALMIALVAAYWMARSITQPLQQLTRFATELGEGRNPDNLPQTYGEVGVLSSTLSQMQQSLSEREQRLIYNAEHDALTDLYNRRAAELRVAEFAQQQSGILLLLNIRQFRHINDAFGFDTGDALLKQLADRLQLLKPEPELTARLGSDEFLLLWQEQPHCIVTAIASLLSPYQLDGTSISLKLSIGYYAFQALKEHPLPVNTLFRRVDIASAHAKLAVDGIASYQAGQDESHLREMTIIQQLPVALQSNQLSICYQPKVSLQTRSCEAAEALIRWHHPELGFIPPDEFIRLAEHSGHIQLITDWMLEQVIMQAAAWASHRPLRLAVNLSPFDLTDTSLPERIEQLLLQHQVPASALGLEVTEGAVMQDPARVITILQQLNDLGIELAIDDFGTGHSSLAYLKQLPVHEVKIDRAFIRDIEHNAKDALIVKAATELAHGLQFKVTAEGLENQAGLSRLQHFGCDTVQGYYFAKPLSAELFMDWREAFPQQQEKFQIMESE